MDFFDNCEECGLPAFNDNTACTTCKGVYGGMMKLFESMEPESNPESDGFVPEKCPQEPEAAPKKAEPRKPRAKEEKPRKPRAKEEKPRKPKVFKKPYKKQNPAERKPTVKKVAYTAAAGEGNVIRFVCV